MPLKCFGQFLSDGRVEQVVAMVVARFHGTSRPASLVFKNSESYGGHFGVPIQSLAVKLFYMK